jgi:hypothetical protein
MKMTKYSIDNQHASKLPYILCVSRVELIVEAP